MSTRLCAPYSYSERRYLPSHDARAITMVEPQTDDNTPPRKRIAVAVSPAPALYPPPLLPIKAFSLSPTVHQPPCHLLLRFQPGLSLACTEGHRHTHIHR